MAASEGDSTEDAAERLNRLREQLSQARAASDLAADGDERSDGHHHPAEAATDADLRERQLANQMKIREIEARIEAAEEAIAEGTYGTCADCGEPIPEGRLRAVPDALRCVPCESRARRLGHA